MPQYWALWMRVEGDLRFLSHLDMMRAMERIAARARLPLRYSQGFNPHPVLSLPCPRPVGVASLDDVVVMALEQDDAAECSMGGPPMRGDPGAPGLPAQSAGEAGGETPPGRMGKMPMPRSCVPLDAGATLATMNKSAPRGMTFTRAQRLEGIKTLHPRRAEYELAINEDRAASVRDKLGELAAMESWPVERRKDDSRVQPRKIDLRPMLADARLEGNVLRWSHLPLGQAWARPGEFLGLLGLDGRVDLAGAIRTKVEYE